MKRRDTMAELHITTMQGTDTVLKDTAIEAFRSSVRGELLCATDASYDTVRKVWNGMIDRRPALIIRCTGVADVIAAVQFARTHDLLVAVRGGGHNVAGHAVCEGGMMIDLSRMKGLRVDPVQRTAHAQPGLTLGEFDRETQAFGLATPMGFLSTTGIAGLTLGGGYGWLARSYGTASDNLRSVDLVTADGQCLTASATEHPDLFWGVRGGGGNFGIVTSFEYQLHPVGPVLGGPVIYPFAQTKAVLQFHREFISMAPDAYTCYPALGTSPAGEPVAVLRVCYHGPLEEGERVLRPLRAFGSPIADLVRPMAYTALQSMYDAGWPSGIHVYWKSNALTELSDDAIDTMVAHCANRPAPQCGMALGQLGGAMSRVGQDETAFNHRHVRYDFISAGACVDPAQDAACIQWARAFWEAMQPFSTGGVYVNYLGQEADEGVERVQAAYGPAKYARLVALKNKYDPTNFFRLNQNIKPTV
jgi:FAD/FMN-containing dehydrogenase